MVFSKFKDKSKKNKAPVKGAPTFEGPVRVKLPKENQVIGILTQRVGGGRMLVSCMDGKTRNCKVPGRLRRGMWLREHDVVIVEPWEFDNEKGGVMFKYSKAAIERLKKMGKLETDNSEF
jgi:translation initiation factor 1A